MFLYLISNLDIWEISCQYYSRWFISVKYGDYIVNQDCQKILNYSAMRHTIIIDDYKHFLKPWLVIRLIIIWIQSITEYCTTSLAAFNRLYDYLIKLIFFYSLLNSNQHARQRLIYSHISVGISSKTFTYQKSEYYYIFNLIVSTCT